MERVRARGSSPIVVVNLAPGPPSFASRVVPFASGFVCLPSSFLRLPQGHVNCFAADGALLGANRDDLTTEWALFRLAVLGLCGCRWRLRRQRGGDVRRRVMRGRKSRRKRRR